MNNTQLVEIQPRELKFKFEVKKQISCVGHLANVTDQYVAFKFKTTSPKMYCVKPHVGIIEPKSTCDFTVTKQAQSSAPPGMLCNDKFLFQATVVPIGTTKDEITRGNFAADSSKTIEEVKLRVTLTSGPSSAAKQEPSYEFLSTTKEAHSVIKMFGLLTKKLNGMISSKPVAPSSMTVPLLGQGQDSIKT